ncbi:MAG: anti-sigma factor antagonist [Clostridia bacterium]|nr:anti-sigma factor antagonist [Clostridia bacterium]MBQ4574100.1 anti-sigma factor antagonist [Clostridia bacterium]
MKQATVKLHTAANRLIAAIGGDIDHHSAADVRAAIDRELYLQKPQILILELSAVDFMDSSGLGLVLGRYTKAKEIGCSTRVANPTAAVERILKLSGCEKYIPFLQDTEITREVYNERKGEN